MKENWYSIAKTLRGRGWNYHCIKWLLPPGSASRPGWRVTIQMCNQRGAEFAEIVAERASLNAAYAAVLQASDEPSWYDVAEAVGGGE